MAADPVEQDLGGRRLGEQNGRGAGREWEQHVGSGRVAEVYLGHRQRDVVLAVADLPLRVALGGVRERAMGLDDRLGSPGGAAREQPNGGMVAMGGERVEDRGR